MIYNELPTVSPWYDKLEKQRRFAENAANNCDYRLVSPANGLLPFQFIAGADAARPTKWEIYTNCEGIAIDISENISKLKAVKTADGVYVYYTGDALKFTKAGGAAVDLEIPEGEYYSKITMPDATAFYSENFYSVPDLSRYFKIEFWNSCDILPIIYGATGWKQLAYIDTFVHVGEPEIEEDGERDGNNNLIPTFQKLVVKYKITAVVPDFLKIAITSTQIHDNVFITTPGLIRSGKVDGIITTSTIENGGAYSTIDVSMEQTIMTKDACCESATIQDLTPWD